MQHSKNLFHFSPGLVCLVNYTTNKKKQSQCLCMRFIGISSDRLWKKPHLSVVDSCPRNMVVESCVHGCCLSAEKHRSRSVNRSFFNGINGNITCKCKNRRCRKQEIPVDLCVPRGSINKAVPLFSQKSSSPLHENLGTVIADESHTAETCTG